MRSRLWKTAGNVVTALLAIILVVMLLFTISAKLSGGTPKIFGYEIMTVLSGSMEPKIHTGSIIAVKPESDPKNLKVGQVVTYRSIDNADILITHRIARIEKSGNSIQYITKGDNNDAADRTPVPSANVVGTYANFTIPFLGYLYSFIKTRQGIVLLMIIPGTLLILWQIVTIIAAIIKTGETEKREKEAAASNEAGKEPV